MKLRYLIHHFNSAPYEYNLDFNHPNYFNNSDPIYKEPDYRLLREHIYYFYRMEILSRLNDVLFEEDRQILNDLKFYNDTDGKKFFLNNSINTIRSLYKDNNWNVLLSKDNFHEELFTERCFENLVYNFYGGWDTEIEEAIEGKDHVDFGEIHDDIMEAISDGTDELQELIRNLIKLRIINEELQDLLRGEEKITEKEISTINQKFVFQRDQIQPSNIEKKVKGNKFKSIHPRPLTANQKVLLLQELGGLKNIEGENTPNRQAEVVSELIDRNKDNVANAIRNLSKTKKEETKQMKEDLELIKKITGNLIFS